MLCDTNDNRRSNIFFNITSPIPGTFIIALHYKGRDKAILEMDLKLDDLLNIQSKDSHEPTYREVKNLKEEDVLLIKSTIMRYERMQNTGHKEAVVMLADQMQSILDVTRQENSLDFLKVILKDYVVLTR